MSTKLLRIYYNSIFFVMTVNLITIVLMHLKMKFMETKITGIFFTAGSYHSVKWMCRRCCDLFVMISMVELLINIHFHSFINEWIMTEWNFVWKRMIYFLQDSSETVYCSYFRIYNNSSIFILGIHSSDTLQYFLINTLFASFIRLFSSINFSHSFFCPGTNLNMNISFIVSYYCSLLVNQYRKGI